MWFLIQISVRKQARINVRLGRRTCRAVPRTVDRPNKGLCLITRLRAHIGLRPGTHSCLSAQTVRVTLDVGARTPMQTSLRSFTVPPHSVRYGSEGRVGILILLQSMVNF